MTRTLQIVGLLATIALAVYVGYRFAPQQTVVRHHAREYDPEDWQFEAPDTLDLFEASPTETVCASVPRVLLDTVTVRDTIPQVQYNYLYVPTRRGRPSVDVTTERTRLTTYDLSGSARIYTYSHERPANRLYGLVWGRGVLNAQAVPTGARTGIGVGYERRRTAFEVGAGMGTGGPSYTVTIRRRVPVFSW